MYLVSLVRLALNGSGSSVRIPSPNSPHCHTHQQTSAESCNQMYQQGSKPIQLLQIQAKHFRSCSEKHCTLIIDDTDVA